MRRRALLNEASLRWVMNQQIKHDSEDSVAVVGVQLHLFHLCGSLSMESSRWIKDQWLEQFSTLGNLGHGVKQAPWNSYELPVPLSTWYTRQNSSLNVSGSPEGEKLHLKCLEQGTKPLSCSSETAFLYETVTEWLLCSLFWKGEVFVVLLAEGSNVLCFQFLFLQDKPQCISVFNTMSN